MQIEELTLYEQLETKLTFKDKNENIVSATNLGNMVVLYLKLKDHKTGRHIGNLKEIKAQLYYFKQLFENKHVLKKMDSFGVNYDVLYRLPDDCIISLSTDCGQYSITVKEAKENGKPKQFKNWELQLVVGREYWNGFKEEPKKPKKKRNKREGIKSLAEQIVSE